MAIRDTPSPQDEVRALYEQGESRTAKAFEELVSKPSFGVLLARSAENVAALMRIGSDFADLVLRNLRLAGRADVTRLAQQLHRTEDKLERLLQEVEGLRDEIKDVPAAREENKDVPAAREENKDVPAARKPRASSGNGPRGNGADAPRRTRKPS